MGLPTAAQQTLLAIKKNKKKEKKNTLVWKKKIQICYQRFTGCHTCSTKNAQPERRKPNAYLKQNKTKQNSTCEWMLHPRLSERPSKKVHVGRITLTSKYHCFILERTTPWVLHSQIIVICKRVTSFIGPVMACAAVCRWPRMPKTAVATASKTAVHEQSIPWTLHALDCQLQASRLIPFVAAFTIS